MYRILNMRSASPASSLPPSIDDRTAKARIRDAAVACFSEHGIAGTTARKVATAAGVSPGLVIHHFGSMDGLRNACDEHIAAIIRQEKQEAMRAGAGLDLLAALRNSEAVSGMGYLARVLVDGSPSVATLVDDLVADAEAYFQQGVEAGMLRPTADPRGRAAVLAMWSLGALVLHQHLERILGVDLTDPEAVADPAIASYLGPVYEILTEGIFTEEMGARMREAVAGMAATEISDETPESSPEPTASRTISKGT